MRSRVLSIAVLLIALALPAQFIRPAAPARYTVKIVRTFPHDRNSFTQGLEFKDGILYEGTGLNGRSTLRQVRLDNAQVLAQVPLPAEYFGEGITVQASRILQLTWKHGQGFVYEKRTLKRIGSFAYPGEGWGLTNDGKQVFMSDGSAQIRVWDGATLKEQRRITVNTAGRPIDQLNELEFINGEIYANVWQTDTILRIAPADGRVLGVIDLSALSAAIMKEAPDADVLNGIAYDAVGKRLFVTGKLWPKIYEVQLVAAN
jgi:glutaminyl-peptide cyclotransferase